MAVKAKRAMVGYYPGGGVYAVGNPGITLTEAQERADEQGLLGFQLFPLGGDDADGGEHLYRRRGENGTYKERGQSWEFAAQLTEYVAGPIRDDKQRSNND